MILHALACKLQAGLKSETSTASSYPGVDPNYSTIPAMAGGIQIPMVKSNRVDHRARGDIEGIRQAGVGGDPLNSPREKTISINRV